MKHYARADVFTGFRLHMALKAHDLDAIFPVRPFLDALGMAPPDGFEGAAPARHSDPLVWYATGRLSVAHVAAHT